MYKVQWELVEAMLNLIANIQLETGLHWLPNANEINTKSMKCTWPTPGPRVWDPTPPIFHLLTLGVRIGDNTNFSIPIGGKANLSVFTYLHVGIPNAKLWCWGSKLT